MADQLKQIAFRKFSLTETQAGTPWNAIVSGANDAYSIKSIEASQGSNTTAGAITATATVSLTTDFSAGKFVEIGVIAKKDRVGLTGNMVVDANSTLTVRPVAKIINFADKKFNIDTENTTGGRYRKSQQELRGTVLGIQDISTSVSVDKTGVTYSGNQYGGGSHSYEGNYTIFHTNANGLLLRLTFYTGNSSAAGMQVDNANTGAMYGFYQTDYGPAKFDGSRYIYWFDENTQKIRYFDLDESETNLASANTMGGGNNTNYYHGIINFVGGSPGSTNTSYDNHFADICIKDGKTYFFFLKGSSKHFFMVELPLTLTNNNASANSTVKFIRLMSGVTSSQTNQFGETGRYSWGYLFNTNGSSADGSIHVTYDPDVERWIGYLYPAGASYGWVATFTHAEYGATANASVIFGNQGLICLTESAINTHVKIPTTYLDTQNNQGCVRSSYVSQNLKPNADSWSIANGGPRYWDGRTLLTHNRTANNYLRHVYQLDLANETATNITSALSGNVGGTYACFHYISFAPSATTIASRTYSSAPSLTVRISGVHENRA